MTAEIFKNIPFIIEFEELYSRLKIRRKEQFSEMIKTFSAEAVNIGKPKGLYKECFITDKGNDYIISENSKFSSRILRKNVDKVNKFYVFLVTCGEELADWASSKDDLIENYIADAVQEHACRIAGKFILDKIDSKFKLSHPSTMNPGSLGDWPIEQQRELFKLIDNESSEIKVSLTESFLMQPTKSVSGIRFAGDVNFCNCQMCPRENCPTRMTEFIVHM